MQLSKHRGLFVLFQYRSGILLKCSGQGVAVLGLEKDHIFGRNQRLILGDGKVDAVLFGVSSKAPDGGFFNVDVGHALVLPHQLFDALLPAGIAASPQVSHHGFKKRLNRQLAGADGQIDRFVFDFFLHKHHHPFQPASELLQKSQTRCPP